MSELILIERIERGPRRFEGEGGVVSLRKPSPFLLAYSPDSGRFGEARVLAGGDRLVFFEPPVSLGEAVAYARAVLADEARAQTDPMGLRRLASSVLAVAWRLGELGDELAAARAPNEGGDAA